MFTNHELNLISRMRKARALTDACTASIWLIDRATHAERRSLVDKLFPMATSDDALSA